MSGNHDSLPNLLGLAGTTDALCLPGRVVAVSNGLRMNLVRRSATNKIHAEATVGSSCWVDFVFSMLVHGVVQL